MFPFCGCATFLPEIAAFFNTHWVNFCWRAMRAVTELSSLFGDSFISFIVLVYIRVSLIYTELSSSLFSELGARNKNPLCIFLLLLLFPYWYSILRPSRDSAQEMSLGKRFQRDTVRAQQTTCHTTWHGPSGCPLTLDGINPMDRWRLYSVWSCASWERNSAHSASVGRSRHSIGG